MSENKQTENDKVARYATQQQEAAVEALQQRAKPKAPQLTKEDVLRISNLPVRKMRVGNIIQDVICDEVTGFIYYPNPNATGPYNRLLSKRTPYVPERDKKPEPAPEPEKEEEVPSPPKLPDAMSKALAAKKDKSLKAKEEKEKKKSEKKPGGLKKKVGLIIGAVAIIAVVICAVPVVKDMLTKQGGDPDPGPVAVEPEESFSIVQVVNDLIPGDVITEDDLKEAVIKAETYNQITLQGINLYQWSRSSALVGMYAQSYLPAGQYVSFSSVGAAYEAPQTLWAPDTYIDLPLTEAQQLEADYIPGERVNVLIRKEVTQESPVTQGQEAVGDGGTATTIVQSTTITEFSLPNTTVCDVFTGADASNSLYQTLAALATVPAGEQVAYINRAMQKEEFADKCNEKVIRVYVHQSDMDKIGNVGDLSKTTISIEKTGELNKDSDERASFVASAQATMKNIQAAKQTMQTTPDDSTEDGGQES